MATTDKDLKIENGLFVTENATIVGNASVGSIVDASSAVTKEYVDASVLAAVGTTAPSSPFAGKLWVDTSESRLKVFNGSSWVTIANVEDANYLPQHIHDTSIEGTGRIISIL